MVSSGEAAMKESMTYLFYDIIDDRIRNRVARVCKDYGLERIQFSGFQGELNRNRRTELHLRLQSTLGKHTGRILILPVCEKDMRERREILVEGEDAHVPDGE
jgi:CRISPR-associated protein Cas2